MTGQGKTLLARYLAEQNDKGGGLIVYDRHAGKSENPWPTPHLFTDPHKAFQVGFHSRNCLVIFDDAGSLGRNPYFDELTTEANAVGDAFRRLTGCLNHGYDITKNFDIDEDGNVSVPHINVETE